jgi:hypothetical protein
MRARRWEVPATTIVALALGGPGPWAATPPRPTPLCPPEGLQVFAGSRGRNPIGAGLAYQRSITCQASGFVRLAAAVEPASSAGLGEACTEGQGALLLNVTLPQTGSKGSCWLAVMRLTDGSRHNFTLKFY